MSLAILAILAASSFVAASPAPISDAVLARSADAPIDDRALAQASHTKRGDRWHENGYYMTDVKEHPQCYAEPNFNSGVVSHYKAGSTVAISCQTHGENVNGNDVWDYTIRDCYVPNDWLKIDHVWVPGLNECAAPSQNQNHDKWGDNGYYITYSNEKQDCYDAPTFASAVNTYYKEGLTSVAISCQTHGDDVDGNNVWDYTIRNCYVPNKKLQIAHVWVPGLKEC